MNIFRITSILWFGTLANAGCAFLTQILISKNFSLENYGELTKIISFSNFCIPIIGLGLGNFVLKIYAEEKSSGNRWNNGIYKYLIFSISIFFVFFYLRFFHEEDFYTIFMVGFFCAVIPGVSVFISLKYQLLGNFISVSIINNLPIVLRQFLLLLYFSFFVQNDVIFWFFFSFPYILMFVFLVFLFFLGKLNIFPFSVENVDVNKFSKVDPNFINTLYGCWPYGVAGIMHLIYFQSALVILGFLSPIKEVAIFNVAFIIVNAVYLLPNNLYNYILLPKIHRWSSLDISEIKKFYRVWSLRMAFFSIVVIFFVFVFVEMFFIQIFSEKYESSKFIIYLMLPAIFCRFLSMIWGAYLSNSNNILFKNKIMGFLALLSICLSFIFVPNYGAWGSAAIYVICEICLMLMYGFFSLRKFREIKCK